MENPPVGLHRVEEALRRSPTSFAFFQAVRLLELLRPDRSAVGEFVDPSEEVARFSVHPSLAFPPSEIRSLEVPEEDGPARVSVNFMGLTGPSGVLPHAYTLLVAERQRARDRATADFLDIFHHRMISLFYRAWKKQHVAAAAPGEDRFREYLFDLAGIGLEPMRGRLPIPDETLLSYLGLLGLQPRGAGALQQLLEDYFDVPVEVEQFVGGWHPVPLRDQCAVGAEDGVENQLGRGALVGDEVWDAQTRVRLRIGPLSRARYAEFLPTGRAHEPLRTLVRFFGHDQFEFEVQLVLARDEVPGFVLGADPESPQPLGWSTWIRSTASALSRDADETVLTLH